jgi:hypothetical protein
MMKKLLLILLLIFNTTNIYATSEDTKLLIELIKSETQANRDLIKAETKANRDLIIANQQSTDKRIKSIDKRLDTIMYIMGILFTATMTGFGIVINYLIKERKEITREVKEDLGEKLELKLTKKADLELVENIITVLEKFGTKNPDIANILKKHNLNS